MIAEVDFAGVVDFECFLDPRCTWLDKERYIPKEEATYNRPVVGLFWV
jgi:hypothetical protein